MISKSLLELEIRTGSTIEGAILATPVANSIDNLGKINSVISSNTLNFNLLGIFGNLDFTITESDTLLTPSTTISPYTSVIDNNLGFNTYDASTVYGGIRMNVPDENTFYQAGSGYNNYSIDAGAHYFAESIPVLTITGNPGYIINSFNQELGFINLDNTTIKSGIESYNTYLLNLSSSDDIPVYAGTEYSSLAAPIIVDTQKATGKTNVLSASLNIGIVQDTRLTQGMVFGTYVKPPVDYNVNEGVAIIPRKQIWTF